MNDRLTVTAEKNKNEKWILVDNGGNELQEGFGYRTRHEAMQGARQIWPSGFPWFGQEDGDGWSIDISEK